jgi:S-layer family protein
MKTTSGVLSASLLLSAASLSAAPVPASGPQWGVTDLSAEVVDAWDMQVSDSGTTWTKLPNLNRYISNAGGGFFVAGVHLPEGALVTTIELEGCDDSVEAGVIAELIRVQAGTQFVLATAFSSSVSTPGCAHFAADLAAPETINNTSRYVVVALNESADGATSIGAVRVFYRLQVSPAPGQPTFSDVPGSDPAFQFIEALAGSGITSGCGGGKYCPDAPLTRRQMAVFLSKALGLDWPQGVSP